MDRHPDKKLTQIVFYTGETIPPLPNKYLYDFAGTKVVHQFNTCIIKDQSREMLEKQCQTNPFALVILASLEHIATKNDVEQRRRTKIRLIRLCLSSPFREIIGQLLIFVEFTIALPAEEERFYREELDQIIYQPMSEGLKARYPEEVKTLEMLIWGKDLDERIEKEIVKRTEERAVKLAEERAVKLAEEKAVKLAEEKAVKLAEERVVMLTEEISRSIEKKHILKMHELGMEPDKIAAILELETSYILQVIEVGKQQPVRPKRPVSPKKKKED